MNLSRKRNAPLCLLTLLALLGVTTSGYAQTMPDDYQAVIAYLGKKGDFKANVLKVGIPRNDLKVMVDGVALPTPFGFGGWLAMTKGKGGNEVMMGDLVLLEDEVNPVMSAILENGLEATALHNHFFWETPRVFYMHIHGYGKAEELAHKVKPALDLIGKIKRVSSVTTTIPASLPEPQIVAGKMDTAKLAQIVGHEGEQTGAVYKITIGRNDIKVKEMGAVINARMGLNTWAAFFGSDENAVIAGDVAMLESEVPAVLRVLRANGLEIVAIHHHMTGSKPMLIFLHYWGKGTAEKLAMNFKAALDVLGKGGAGMKMGH